MNELKDALRGKKSYLAAGMLVLLGVGTALGYVTDLPPEVVEGAKLALLGALGGALKAAVAKAEAK